MCGISARAPFYVSAHTCVDEKHVYTEDVRFTHRSGERLPLLSPRYPPETASKLLLLLTPDIILRVPTPLSFTASKNKSLIHNAWMTIALKGAAVSQPSPPSPLSSSSSPSPQNPSYTPSTPPLFAVACHHYLSSYLPSLRKTNVSLRDLGNSILCGIVYRKYLFSLAFTVSLQEVRVAGLSSVKSLPPWAKLLFTLDLETFHWVVIYRDIEISMFIFV